MVQTCLSSEDQRKALTFPDGCDWRLLHSDSKQQDALFKAPHTYTCMLLISTHLTSHPGNCQLRSSEMWRARVPAAESRSLSFCPQPWMESTAFEASRNLCCVLFTIINHPAVQIHHCVRHQQEARSSWWKPEAALKEEPLWRLCDRVCILHTLPHNLVSTGNHSEKY